MRLADLSADALEKIRRYRFDRMIEKHEGPWGWDNVLEYSNPEFIELASHHVLLPVDGAQLPNISLLRCVEGDGGAILTLFLRDTTYGHEWYDSGFLAICENVPGEEFYLATVYHAWFIIENG